MTLRVLVVEDDSLIQMSIVGVLEEAGFKVCAADTASMAEEALKNFKPEFAVLDLNLGQGPDGVAVAGTLRRDFNGVPIAFLTAHADKESVERMGRVKPVAIMSKPFDDDALLSTIKRARHA